MILEIENYSKTINKRIILDNINLTFRSGNVYGFYGRNGSGKTMLFRALTTLIYPTKGDVKLDYAGDKKYKEYSLGMKQRLRIAQAIMENQKIIILDEPTNGIDRNGLKDVHEIIKEEKNKGKIILLASHDLDDLKLLCDKIYFIENGRVKDFLTEISND